MKIRILVGAALALWIAIPTEAVRAQDQEERQVTLIGCVMRDHEYRDMYGPGLSGPRGAGIGGRNEYMLVDAREVAADAPRSVDVNTNTCPPAPGTFPTAYELTGSREDELGAFLGRRVQITGIQKEAAVRPVGTSGILRPTGGFDPLGHELHLFEVEIASFREPVPALAEAPPAEPPARAEAPAPAPEPEPEPKPDIIAAVPEPQPAPAEPQETPAVEEPAPQVAQVLPRTASPLPFAGLIGLLSLLAAAGVRAFRG